MTNLGKLVTTTDGSLSLIHPEHDECYHSSGGARWEAESLYCQASGFAERMKETGQRVYVLDVGLGLGYNACSSLDTWINSPGGSDLALHSLEVNVGLVEALRKGQGAWQGNWKPEWISWCKSLQATHDSQHLLAEITHPLSAAKAQWFIHVGDALETCRSIQAYIAEPWDFIWQDPFSPDKNPRMWDRRWFTLLKENSSAETNLLTYSVARVVKNALLEANWSYEKVKASGPKRHWLKAKLPVGQC